MDQTPPQVPSTMDAFSWPPTRDLHELLDRWDPLRMVGRDPFAMPVEELVEDDHLVVRAELPGIDPEKDISITVEDHSLHITAQRREEHTEQDRQMYRREMRYGAFSRVIELPLDTKDDEVAASYADGVLTIRLPVDTERTAARRIPIQRG